MELILCSNCKRLWPEGTTWCGNCRRTLGKRICPDGHISPVYSDCCSTCGSSKLTPAASALNLRPVTFLGVIGVAVILVPAALEIASLGIHSLYFWLLGVVLERLIVLGLFSWFAGLILGERARRAIGDLWLALARMAISILVAFGQYIVNLFRR